MDIKTLIEKAKCNAGGKTYTALNALGSAAAGAAAISFATGQLPEALGATAAAIACFAAYEYL